MFIHESCFNLVNLSFLAVESNESNILIESHVRFRGHLIRDKGLSCPRVLRPVVQKLFVRIRIVALNANKFPRGSFAAHVNLRNNIKIF